VGSEILLPVAIAASFIVSILTAVLNIRIQTRVLGERYDLRTGFNVMGYICLGLGLFSVIVGAVLVARKLFSWAPWVSTGIIILFSVSVPLLIGGARLGKTEGDFEEFARELDTFAEWLIAAAAVMGAIVIIYIDVLVTRWWMSLSG
jgi:hypothetical protein